MRVRCRHFAGEAPFSEEGYFEEFSDTIRSGDLSESFMGIIFKSNPLVCG